MAGIEKIARRVDWGDYAVFLAIADSGSLSRAAELLGRTQPTLSKKLDNLEGRLGVRLFERTSGGMSLTDMGKAIYARVDAINRSAKDIEHISARADNSDTGEVTLHCMDLLSAQWIVRHIPDFHQSHPGVSLSLRSQIQGYEDKDTAHDLSIQFNTNKPMEFKAHSLGSLHFMPMVTQAYVDRWGLPRNANDAVNHNIMFLRRTGLKVENWRQKAEALRELLDPSVSTDSGHLVLSAVLAGAGVSMLPTFLTQTHPELIVLDYDITHSYPFWLVHNSYLSMQGRVGITYDWLREIFKPGENPWFADDFIHPKEFCNNQIIAPH